MPKLLRTALTLAALGLPLFSAPSPIHAAIVNSLHDFINPTRFPDLQPGFKGGGVCAACHTPHFSPATASLFARTPRSTGTVAPALLCLDCHGDGAGNASRMPTGGLWKDVWNAPMPRAVPTSHVGHVTSGGSHANCTKRGCHLHSY